MYRVKAMKKFVPITKPLGLNIDVSNIADVLETLDQEDTTQLLRCSPGCQSGSA